jgi:hypothetical protein
LAILFRKESTRRRTSKQLITSPSRQTGNNAGLVLRSALRPGCSWQSLYARN